MNVDCCCGSLFCGVEIYDKFIRGNWTLCSMAAVFIHTSKVFGGILKLFCCSLGAAI